MRTLLALTVCLVLAGCAGGGSSVGQSAPPTSGGTPTATTTVTQTPSPVSNPSVLLCAPSNTALSVEFGQGAAGTEYEEFRATNTASKPCRTGGYPGAQLLGTRGQPLATHVERDSSRAPNQTGRRRQSFVVAPGASFFVEFHYSSVEPNCEHRMPRKATRIRLTLPDNRDSVELALRRTEHSGPIYACDGTLSAFAVFKRRT